MKVEEEFLKSVAKLYDRDLNKLEGEIRAYSDEASLWKTSGDIRNSGGNLCLHLCGNLQTYIGKNLGNFPYARDRDNEFAAKNISKDQLISEVKKTREVVLKTLISLNTDLLVQEYPEQVFDYDMNTLHFLIHLESHLNYHLGQINYHRRLMIDK